MFLQPLFGYVTVLVCQDIPTRALHSSCTARCQSSSGTAVAFAVVEVRLLSCPADQMRPLCTGLDSFLVGTNREVLDIELVRLAFVQAGLTS